MMNSSDFLSNINFKLKLENGELVFQSITLRLSIKKFESELICCS